VGETEEDLTGMTGTAPIEAKGVLVEVALQMLVADRALIGAQEPALQQRRDPVHPWQVTSAGLVLTGSEIKSLRAGKAQLKDSYGRIDKGEVWLFNAHISPYEASSAVRA